MSKKNNNNNAIVDDENILLYDLDWLKEGEQFPPASQIERINKYKRNKKLFETKQMKVYADALGRIQFLVGDNRRTIINPVVLNYNKLLSIKTADLCCGEEPKITAEGQDRQETVDDIIENVEMNKTLYETVIDISRYGDAIWRLYKNDDSKGDITIWDPTEWFPVISIDNKKKITNHVLAWKIYKGKDLSGNKKYELHAQVHYKKYYDHYIFEMKNENTIGKLISKEKVNTGMDDFAVIHFSNVTTSDSPFGHDDYVPVDSIISELMVRFGQIQSVLDKHASPALQGPITALEFNEKTGHYQLKLSSYFAKNPEDEEVKYLTWDGNLESAFKEIEMLFNQLLIISEMGTALLGSVDSAGYATSGTTMRLRMVNPLFKSRRFVNNLHNGIKRALTNVSQIGYTKLEKKDITIDWLDGLPNDPKEEAEIMSVRTGNKSTISQKKAIMHLEDMTEEQAQKEVDEIQKEAENSMIDFEFPNIDEPPKKEDEPPKSGDKE